MMVQCPKCSLHFNDEDFTWNCPEHSPVGGGSYCRKHDFFDCHVCKAESESVVVTAAPEIKDVRSNCDAPKLYIPTVEDILDLGRLNLMTDTEFSQSKVLYVVMDAHRSTILKNPGLESPFKTWRKKHAETVARQSGGVVETLRDAIKLVAKCACNLPKDHPKYSPDPKVKLK